ncbi:MAG TPA: hypothetical protein VFG62_24455 [Rhodopila sp.]|jgi:hypothetical protein|nr:hypothetical protein [Rhodopila sp.]
MRFSIFLAAVLTLGTFAAQQAEAKGCIKGAVVGGVAGHMVHHGVLGAAGGCAVGHHEASKHAWQQREMQQQPQTTHSEDHPGN